MTHIEVSQIEDSVPIPVRRGTGVNLEAMEPGQSIAFPLALRRKVQVNASALKRRTGRAFTIRKVDKEVCRVWRVS